MKGPFYQLEEAQQKLNLTQTDLLYAIENGELTPVLSGPVKPFLAVTIDENKRYTGHAHFKYQGPLGASTPLFEALAKQQQGKFFSKYQIFDTASISTFSTDYPLSSKLPNSALVDWIPIKLDDLASGNYTIIAMPFEMKSVKQTLNLLVDAAKSKELFSPENNNMQKFIAVPYEYNWYYNGNWAISDIRIPASEIEQFKKPKRKTEKDRENQLHEVILRAKQSHPNYSNTDLWKIIKEDAAADRSIYDNEGVIQQMTQTEITWKSSYGHEQIMKRKTFQNWKSVV